MIERRWREHGEKMERMRRNDREKVERRWNRLPREVTLSGTLPGLKAKLGAFMKQFYDRPPVRGYTTVPNDFREAGRKNVV